MEALICLTVLGIALIYSEFTKNIKIQSAIALIGLAATLLCCFYRWGQPSTYFNNMGLVDNFAISFNSLIVISTMLVVLLAAFYYKNGENHVGEILGLMVFSIFGAFLITGYTNLIMLYLGFETLSIPLYVLAGSKKSSFKSNEAGFKYFVLGSVASAILLLGLTFIYGTFGTMNMNEIAQGIGNTPNLPGFFYIGLIFTMIGFLFKIAAMPFHFWAPDVYEGSPSIVTAFFASVVKIAAFVAFYRLMASMFVQVKDFWSPVLWAITALTLIGSNVIALNQNNVKRLLAYGSISSSGFLLLAVLALTQADVNVLYYYLVAYAFAIIPAFGVVMAVRKSNGGNDTFDAFTGLAHRNPYLAGNMLIALFSLAGIPFTAGFFAKFYLFVSAIAGGFLWITIVAVIAAVMGIYYFIRLISKMFAKTEDSSPIPSNLPLNIVLGIASLVTLVLGLFPSLILQ
jgi:NADH-quinone oxidoreductase subunit N